MDIPLRKAAARIPRSHVACSACALRQFCFSTAGTEGYFAVEAGLVARRRLKSGETLFSKGSTQTALYAVRAGFLKTCAVLPDGGKRILGYHIMGDVLGLDAMASGAHPTEAVALNGCEVCEMSIERAQRLMAGRQAVSVHLRNLMSEEIVRAEERIVSLGAMSARQRVAGFLLDLAARWARRGYSPSEFDLCLTRKEIGSYLGLTFETVSRTLSLFASRQWIGVDGREIRILERAALQSQLVED
jgi:CRP/FNR family transcriptional regulator